MSLKDLVLTAIKNKKSFPSKEYISSILKYDYSTGDFSWISTNSNRVKAGSLAGSVYTKNGKKYRVITIDGVKYKAHTLVWIYFNGTKPDFFLDHIDGNGLNNRIDNLRLSDKNENQKNLRRYSSNKSGYCGVIKKKKKWSASINEGNNKYMLGCFDSIEEAAMKRIYAQFFLGFSIQHGTQRPL